MTLYLLRHAVAVPKDRWADDDVLRPLSGRGRWQTTELVRWFGARPPVQTIAASPTARCLATVLPVAASCDLDIVARRELLPGRVSAAAELVRHLLAGADSIVCTHGELIPELLEALGATSDEAPPWPCAKGSVWALTRTEGGITADYLPPPRPLVASTHATVVVHTPAEAQRRGYGRVVSARDASPGSLSVAAS